MPPPRLSTVPLPFRALRVSTRRQHAAEIAVDSRNRAAILHWLSGAALAGDDDGVIVHVLGVDQMSEQVGALVSQFRGPRMCCGALSVSVVCGLAPTVSQFVTELLSAYDPSCLSPGELGHLICLPLLQEHLPRDRVMMWAADVMKHWTDRRRAYFSGRSERLPVGYLSRWAANFEVSDVLRWFLHGKRPPTVMREEEVRKRSRATASSAGSMRDTKIMGTSSERPIAVDDDDVADSFAPDVGASATDRIVFIRVNQYPLLPQATHEERERIAAEEHRFGGRISGDATVTYAETDSSLIVDTPLFGLQSPTEWLEGLSRGRDDDDGSSRQVVQQRGQRHPAEARPTRRQSPDSPYYLAVVDVIGHFVVMLVVLPPPRHPTCTSDRAAPICVIVDSTTADVAKEHPIAIAARDLLVAGLIAGGASMSARTVDDSVTE